MENLYLICSATFLYSTSPSRKECFSKYHVPLFTSKRGANDPRSFIGSPIPFSRGNGGTVFIFADGLQARRLFREHVEAIHNFYFCKSVLILCYGKFKINDQLSGWLFWSVLLLWVFCFSFSSIFYSWYTEVSHVVLGDTGTLAILGRVTVLKDGSIRTLPLALSVASLWCYVPFLTWAANH